MDWHISFVFSLCVADGRNRTQARAVTLHCAEQGRAQLQSGGQRACRSAASVRNRLAQEQLRCCSGRQRQSQRRRRRQRRPQHQQRQQRQRRRRRRSSERREYEAIEKNKVVIEESYQLALVSCS